MPGYKKLFLFTKNTVFQLLSRVVTTLTSLIIIRLFTNYTGIESYGLYQTVVIYTSFFWILTDFGLNALFVRDIKKEHEKTSDIYAINLSTRIFMGLLLMVIALLGMLAMHYSTSVKIAIVVSLLTILSQSVFGANVVLFQSKLKYKYHFFAYAIASVVNLIITFVAVSITKSLPILVLGYVASNITLALSSFYFAKKVTTVKLVIDVDKSKEYLKATIPIGLSLFFSLGINKVDTLILSTVKLTSGMDNATAVAIYALAYKVFELASVPAVLSMNTLYPMIGEFFAHHSRNQTIEVIKKVFAGMLLMGIVATLFVYIAMDYLYEIIVPGIDSFIIDEVKNVLTILITGLPLFYLTVIPMYLLILFKKQQFLLYVYLSAFLASVPAYLILIPKYSYYAGAIITIVTEVFILLALYSGGFIFLRNVTSET